MSVAAGPSIEVSDAIGRLQLLNYSRMGSEVLGSDFDKHTTLIFVFNFIFFNVLTNI